jgi:phage tail-like protein
VSRLQLVNLDPERDEANVRRDSMIALDLIDTLGVGADVANTAIEVDGVPVFAGGAFVPPFTGAQFSPYAGAERWAFDHVAEFDWASLDAVVVHVESQTLDLLVTLDESYSFRVEDFDSPRLDTAVARTLTVVRATFVDPSAMRMSDPSDPTDALNPANYALARAEAPSVVPSVLSVTKVDDYTVDLTLDVQLSPSRAYTLAVSGIADEWGNVVVGTPVAFTAPPPPFPATRRFDLWKMLPEINRRKDVTGELRAFIKCLQEIVDLLLIDVDAWTDILDPDVAPEAFLDAILADLGNPFDFDLSETDRRRLVRVLLPMYRQKGTAAGIINAVRFFLGIAITITCPLDEETWVLGESELGETTFLGPGDAWSLYSFVIYSPVVLTDEQRRQIREIAEYMKPAHTHLAAIVEPTTPPVYDHVELGISLLGTDEWDLHE